MNLSPKIIFKVLLMLIYFGLPIRTLCAAGNDDVFMSDLISGKADGGTIDKPAPANTGFLPVLARTICALLLVLMLAFVAVLGMKYCRWSPVAQFESLKIMHKLPLAARKAVYVVKAGDKALVLGVSENAISCLATMNSSDFPITEPASTPGATKFGEMLAIKIRAMVEKREA